MGKMAVGSIEMAQQVAAAALTAVSGPVCGPIPLLGCFNVAVSGVFVGTVQLQCSFDGGTTFIPVFNKHTGAIVSFTSPTALQEDEVEPGVLYQIACTAFTSGTITCRLSAGVDTGDFRRLT